jgi:hypothetical protein
MRRTKISSTDLIWIIREKLMADGSRRDAPIAIVPDNRSWRAIAGKAYAKRFPECAKRVGQIEKELREIYVLDL